MAKKPIPTHPQTGKPKKAKYVERKLYPSADRVRELLDYNPTTGVLTWRYLPSINKVNRIRNMQFAGKIAGSTANHGYIRISVDRTQYLAHRLAWIWMYGFNPDPEIDHINRIVGDNRISNLRLVNNLEQVLNRKISVRNTSGHLGVSFYKASGKWCAQICRGWVKKHIGFFETKEQASEAYQAAVRKYDGHTD
jgi:hypothetical protein